MSESERMPGKRKRSHVPPSAPRASRIANDLCGQRCWSRQPAPTPEMPAPTIRTSTCSEAMVGPSLRPCAARDDVSRMTGARVLTHLLLVRIEGPRAELGGGALFALPFAEYDELLDGSFTDARREYESTAPVFFLTEHAADAPDF